MSALDGLDRRLAQTRTARETFPFRSHRTVAEVDCAHANAVISLEAMRLRLIRKED